VKLEILSEELRSPKNLQSVYYPTKNITNHHILPLEFSKTNKTIFCTTSRICFFMFQNKNKPNVLKIDTKVGQQNNSSEKFCLSGQHTLMELKCIIENKKKMYITNQTA
jgi:hypothetical protein